MMLGCPHPWVGAGKQWITIDAMSTADFSSPVTLEQHEMRVQVPWRHARSLNLTHACTLTLTHARSPHTCTLRTLPV